MSIDFTQNDIIRYIYDDVSSSERSQIAQAIEANWELKEIYNELCQSLNVLNKFKLKSPSQSSIDMILGFSRKSNLETISE